MNRTLRLVLAGIVVPFLFCQAQESKLDQLCNRFTHLFHRQHYSVALQVATEAVAVAKSTLVANDPRLADALEHLAMASAQRGRYDQASLLYRQAIDIRTAHSDSDDAALVHCTHSLGNVYYWAGSFDEAGSYYTMVAKRLMAAGMYDRVELAQALQGMAEVAYEKENYAEAAALLQHAITTYILACGDGDPLYRGAELRLASIYLADRKSNEASLVYRRVIDNLGKHLGNDHSTLTPALMGLARVVAQMGNALEAEDLYARVVEIDRWKFGESSPAYATDLATLADHYASVGRYQDAEPLAEQVAKIWEEMPTGRPMNTARAYDRLASIYNGNGKVIGAETMYKRAIELAETNKDTSCAVLYMKNLASMYSEAGNLMAAKETLERAIAVVDAHRLKSVDRESLHDQYATVMITLNGTTDFARIQDAQTDDDK